MTPCDVCGSIIGTGARRDGRLVLCHACYVHNSARCAYCDARIDPNNYARGADGLSCLPCDAERAHAAAIHH